MSDTKEQSISWLGMLALFVVCLFLARCFPPRVVIVAVEVKQESKP